jgi:hypothetical protein
MALVRLSSYGDIEDGLCAALQGLASDVNVVLSDDPNDFFVASPCQLGNEVIQNGLENTNVNYVIPVIDPVTNCVIWNSKPPDPQYGSEMLQPWTGDAHEEIVIDSGIGSVLKTEGGVTAWHLLADIEIPAFPVDVKLFVYWTALWHHGASDGLEYCEWYPGYGEAIPYPAQSEGVGFANEKLGGWNQIVGYWVGGTFCKILDLAANTPGKHLYAMFIGTRGNAYARVSAVAFKA